MRAPPPAQDDAAGPPASTPRHAPAPSGTSAAAEPAVDAIRRFHRFITRRIAFRDGTLLWAPFSLSEARVLFEIRSAHGLAATDLAAGLGLDAGYVSRLLRRLVDAGLVERTRAEADGRRQVLSLTAAGCAAVDDLVARARAEARRTVDALRPGEVERLLGAMRTVETLLGGTGPLSEEAAAGPVVLREHRPGDLGWILHRHGVLYDESDGWGVGFEVEVADVLVEVFRAFDRARDRSFIAEIDGRTVGAVVVVREEAGVARLRLLYVEPDVRGRGVGWRLIEEAISFARAAGYERLVLWTTSSQTAARRLYARAGFERTAQVSVERWGSSTIDETWELDLTRTAG